MKREEFIRQMTNEELCDYYFEHNCKECSHTEGCREIRMLELDRGRCGEPTGDEVRAMSTKRLADYFRKDVKWLEEEV